MSLSFKRLAIQTDRQIDSRACSSEVVEHRFEKPGVTGSIPVKPIIENFIERNKMDFRAEIKKLMKQKKVSISKLARDADLNYGTVYYFLKGTSQMRTSNLEKLFDILNKI